ncbi:hypothetical protein [Mycobacterium sp. GA-2829]|uniref:hypothetical protein n=1 Tax=Mycobacterium sp. GA-2829 TaxID=1772283 RepID=UPI000AC98BD8|nr:hypothetical protein [Mycobacterium sp. GA-2829]
MAEPVTMTQVEVADYDLGLRGKMMRAGKSHKPGLAFCTIVYGLSLVDEVTDTPFSNVSNGYPDAALAVDESTASACRGGRGWTRSSPSSPTPTAPRWICHRGLLCSRSRRSTTS